jgi:hypothetical protein
LINAILTDTDPYANFEFYKSYLDSFNVSGPYRLKGFHHGENVIDTVSFQTNGWGSFYRWTRPNASYGRGGVDGIFSGLDYLYFHNLFYLVFSDRLPSYNVNYSCFCEPPEEIQIRKDEKPEIRKALMDLNHRMSYLPNCVEDLTKGKGFVQSDLILKPQFAYYDTLGIRTVRYIRTDTEISKNGLLDVYTDLVVDKRTRLKVRGELHIREGSVLFLSEGAQIILFDDSRLIVDPGADIKFAEDVKFYVSDNCEIKLSDDSLKERIKSLSE